MDPKSNKSYNQIKKCMCMDMCGECNGNGGNGGNGGYGWKWIAMKIHARKVLYS